MRQHEYADLVYQSPVCVRLRQAHRNVDRRAHLDDGSVREGTSLIGQNGRCARRGDCRGFSEHFETKNRLLAETQVSITTTQIAVYDLTLKRRILTVNVDPLPKNDYDFALSPDGSKLAILNDRRVSVYSVPVIHIGNPN